ncbi:MAG: metallophosphoesterase [Leptospirales bacterium]|nr:metallophosphoesterase [Leptospirales bacterium]
MNFYWNHFSPTNLVLDLIIAVTLPLFVFWLVRRKGSNLDRRARFFLILKALAFYFVLILIISAVPGISTFLRAHFLWTVGSVVLPATIVVIAFRVKRYALLLLALPLLGIKYYAEVYEPRNLEVSYFTTQHRAIQKQVRIAHLSDLQTDGIGPMHLDVREALLAFKPDLVVFTGDVLNHKDLIPEVYAWLKSLNSGRDYFVTGNVDGLLDLNEFEQKTGFKVMDGKQEELQINGQRLGLIGLGLPDFRNDNLLKFLHSKTSSPYTILLSHYPDAMFLARNRNIDLLLAGHTHGGQIVIPGFGPIMTLSHVPRKIGAGGMHQVEDLTVVVSRGLGMEGHVAPRVRIFCRPQLVLLTLAPEQASLPAIR